MEHIIQSNFLTLSSILFIERHATVMKGSVKLQCDKANYHKLSNEEYPGTLNACIRFFEVRA